MDNKNMKFCVPTNWQEDLLPSLDKKYISEIYGSFDRDIIGGGRASVILPHVSKKKALLHINEVHRNGLEFNYLINATCLNNSEWSISWQRFFHKLMDYITKAGVGKVTVSIPYLLELIKKHYPGLRVCISVQAGTQNAHQARFWQELGADEITLFMDVNRDFRLLRHIRQQIRCKLKLIANLACLYGCPFYHYHANLNSHASQIGHQSRGFIIDYCTLHCRQIKISRPEELIRARWIRPEDVGVYEDFGIDGLKLVNRDMKTDAICLIVKAYSERAYKGNLFDLFPGPSKNLSAYGFSFRKAAYFFKPLRINIFKLYKAKKIFSEDRFYIDNQKLNGFLGHFLDNDCSRMSCQECGYCEKKAKEAVSVPADFKLSQLRDYNGFLEKLINGDFFKYP